VRSNFKLFLTIFDDLHYLQLQSEIKIHKVLDHENIVKFERCFEDPSYYYLLMELCHNQVLDVYVHKHL
jgi:serine/threonine protein kinase